MAAKKKKNPPKIKTASKDTPQEKQHWFPEDAKAPSAATAPAKKASPWQRKQTLVNYGTLAKPGVSMRELFNNHCDTKLKKLSESQRKVLWSVVGQKMLTQPLDKLIEIIDQESKNNLGPK